jgi:hypothetical protein
MAVTMHPGLSTWSEGNRPSVDLDSDLYVAPVAALRPTRGNTQLHTERNLRPASTVLDSELYGVAPKRGGEETTGVTSSVVLDAEQFAGFEPSHPDESGGTYESHTDESGGTYEYIQVDAH